MMDQQEAPYALSIGTKIIDLGWPWIVDTHVIAEKMHLLEPNTKISMKIELDPFVSGKIGDEPEWSSYNW